MARDTLEWIFQKRYRKQGRVTQNWNLPRRPTQENRSTTFLIAEISPQRTKWLWMARIQVDLNSSIELHSLDSNDTYNMKESMSINSTKK